MCEYVVLVELFFDDVVEVGVGLFGDDFFVGVVVCVYDVVVFVIGDEVVFLVVFEV